MNEGNLGLQLLGLLAVAIVTTVVLGGYRITHSEEWRRPNTVEAAKPDIADWWDNLGRDGASITCRKEALLARDEARYYALCMKEKGYDQ